MGTLDDAIRQHLELKRRSGASEEEVDRLQSEAFGAGSTAPTPPPAPEPAPAWADDDPDEVPSGESLEHRTSELTPAADEAPPVDYVAPDEEEGDDLLEETPDFLQETPEHDRLWFEQKPPRDFDFNE